MFLQYLKRIRFVLLWSLLCAGIFFLIFVLEEINLKAAVYPTVLCLAFGLLFLLCGYLRYKKTGQKLEHLLQGEGPYEDSLPVAQDGIESGYQELIRREEQQQRTCQMGEVRSGYGGLLCNLGASDQGTDCCDECITSAGRY